MDVLTKIMVVFVVHGFLTMLTHTHKRIISVATFSQMQWFVNKQELQEKREKN